jgi:hypothetical protein
MQHGQALRRRHVHRTRPDLTHARPFDRGPPTGVDAPAASSHRTIAHSQKGPALAQLCRVSVTERWPERLSDTSPGQRAEQDTGAGSHRLSRLDESQKTGPRNARWWQPDCNRQHSVVRMLSDARAVRPTRMTSPPNAMHSPRPASSRAGSMWITDRPAPTELGPGCARSARRLSVGRQSRGDEPGPPRAFLDRCPQHRRGADRGQGSS